jgi:hypothetical protein
MESKLKENTNNIGKKRGRKPKPKEEKQEINLEKKKRGRKPKPKEEKEEVDTSFPKKRGRKPKPKHPLELLAKVPKKRGRKPKDKYGYGVSQTKPVNNITFNNDNENIILHLPIHSSQLLNNEFVEQKLLEYNPNISVPTPYEEMVHSNPFSSNYSAPYPFDKHEHIEQEKISNESEEYSNSESEGSDTESQESVYRKMNLKYEDKNIFYDDDEENETMVCQYEESNFKIKMNNNSSSSQSSKNTMLQFKEANNRNKWPESTSIYCWWCCSPFNNVPCALPLRKKNDEYIVSGCFCSPECAAAWNFDNSDSEERWERNSLLNVIYKKVFENKNINIKPAPPRQSLKIFGGNLTIEEFRKNNSNYNKNYKIVMPPMVSIIPQLEESVNNSFYNQNKSFIPIDKERIEKANKDLKLKRSKPLSDKRNTLENCMKLKYI